MEYVPRKKRVRNNGIEIMKIKIVTQTADCGDWCISINLSRMLESERESSLSGTSRDNKLPQWKKAAVTESWMTGCIFNPGNHCLLYNINPI